MTTIMTCFVGGKRARLVSGAGGASSWFVHLAVTISGESGDACERWQLRGLKMGGSVGMHMSTWARNGRASLGCWVTAGSCVLFLSASSVSAVSLLIHLIACLPLVVESVQRFFYTCFGLESEVNVHHLIHGRSTSSTKECRGIEKGRKGGSMLSWRVFRLWLCGSGAQREVPALPPLSFFFFFCVRLLWMWGHGLSGGRICAGGARFVLSIQALFTSSE